MEYVVSLQVLLEKVSLFVLYSLSRETFTSRTCVAMEYNGFFTSPTGKGSFVRTIYYILYTMYYILYTIYYILYTIYYILYTIYYILYTIYYIL